MHREKVLYLAISFLCLGTLTAAAHPVDAVSPAPVVQSRIDVAGQVLDETGSPVIGASVSVLGTTAGAVTDLDGRFSLQCAEGATLEISCIGYVTQTVTAASRLAIVLQEDVLFLDDVVVTALGIKRSTKALSYSAQEFKSDAILAVKDANLINALNGKVAGVTINTSSSGVGGASKVVMRGTKSIAQSSNALYVIDGVPMYNQGGSGSSGAFGSQGVTEAIADLNPEDIESLTVLTGAAAAALYGSNAANGAIVITTKKGAKGHLQLSLSQNTEFLTAFRTPEFQNTYGTGDLNSATGSVDHSWGMKLNEANTYGYDPLKDYLQTGVVTTETVTLSTGTDRNQTYASLSALNSKGMVPNNGYDRYNVTVRNTTSFLNDKMTLDAGVSYILQTDRNMVNQGTYANPLVTAYLFPRGDDWNDIRMYERWDTSRGIYTQYWPQGIDEFVGQNPYWINYRNLRENRKHRYMLNLGLTYQILDWLSVQGRVRTDNSTNAYTQKYYATTNMTLAGGSSNGLYGATKTEDSQLYGDLIATVNKTFESGWSFMVNAGASYSSQQEDVLGASGPIAASGIPNVFNVLQLDDSKTGRSQSGYHDVTQSVFGSAEVGYKSTYFLTVTGRNDWPSQLAGPNSSAKSFFYPSVGGSIVLSEALPLPKAVEFAKIRASYASVGLPFPRFLANPTYSWDGSNKVWQSKRNYPMYNLKPERTNSWEVGLNLRMWNFNLDVTYYNSRTFNQTFDPNISVSSGYSTLYVQTGNVRNDGVEFSLGYDNQWNNGFRFASTYVLSMNRNRILELMDNYVHPETGAVISKERLDIGGLGQARFILKKGGTLGDLYSNADIQRDSEGNVLINQDGTVVANYNADDLYLGSVLPKANMSWRNEIGFKGLSLSCLVTARLGGICYSATQAALDAYGVSKVTADARDAGGVPVNGGDLVNAENWYSIIGARSGIPQYYAYSATNVRLQEASIGYTLSRKVLKLCDASISLVGRNLFFFYCRAPFDPEAVATTGNYYQGIDCFMMPASRSVGFNVKLTF